ncbi:DUF397 domain-containing protein [Streptomyces sp. NBC_01450]|uniref:DUF397 domain-containing protein n=1 Tax=Streptomyces sp. NBC_01450 TaxID=2903871 RepID=UPI002E342479|nr:DUF397 domain-containing protein [Streptomyces sp. NBC_01450]
MESNSRLTSAQWRKSSYSTDTGGSCVEIAETPCANTIAVRDSKNPAGPILTIAPAAFVAFVSWTTTAG